MGPVVSSSHSGCGSRAKDRERFCAVLFFWLFSVLKPQSLWVESRVKTLTLELVQRVGETSRRRVVHVRGIVPRSSVFPSGTGTEDLFAFVVVFTISFPYTNRVPNSRTLRRDLRAGEGYDPSLSSCVEGSPRVDVVNPLPQEPEDVDEKNRNDGGQGQPDPRESEPDKTGAHE